MQRVDQARAVKAPRSIVTSLAATLLLTTAASAETLTVTDLSTAIAGDSAKLTGTYAVSVPSIEIVDGNLSEDQVRALFAEDPTSAMAALGKLDAASVSIPEIIVTNTMSVEGESTDTTTTYKGLTLTDVVDGVAAESVLADTTMSFGAAETPFSMTFGAMRIDDFSLAAMLGFYGIGDAMPADEFATVYSDFTVEGGGLTVGDFSCSLDPIDGGEMTARPLRTSLAEIEQLAAEMEDYDEASDEPPPQEVIQKFVDFYIDIFTAYTSDPVTAEGFSCEGTGPEGEAITLGSGTMAMGAMQPGVYPELAMNDFDVTVDENHFSFGNFTFKQTDLTGPIDFLESYDGAFTADWFEQNWRQMIPAFAGLSMADIDFDLPVPPETGPEVEDAEDAPPVPDVTEATDRIKGSLGLFDITLGQYVNAIPADIDITLDNMVVPVPDNDDEMAVTMRALGLDTITTSLGAGISWNEADQTITVSRLLLDVDQFGRVELSGTLGNATAALFDGSDAVALAAAQSMTLKDLRIQLQDEGMLAIAVAAASADAQQPEAVFRMTMSGMAQGLAMAILGNTETALAAAQALGGFIAGQQDAVDLTLTAVDPAGLSIVDLAMAGEDPTTLAGKLAVTVNGAPTAAE